MTFCAVPVLPATWKPSMAASVQVPPASVTPIIMSVIIFRVVGLVKMLCGSRITGMTWTSPSRSMRSTMRRLILCPPFAIMQ